MAKNAHKLEKAIPCCSVVEPLEPRDLISLSAERRNLISAANKVFGEGKWSHTVVKQTLHFDHVHSTVGIDGERRSKYRFRCVSYVKVQLENGDCYEDDGSYIAEESTKNLSTQKVRIGSVENALKKILLSFGDKIERELEQLQRQISFEQESTDLATNFVDLISAANKVFGEGKWNHTVVSQTLNFDACFDVDIRIGAPNVYRAGCVSFVKIQLENGNFHEDVGYYNAEEFTKGLSIQNARIGSAVNALKRVLLSFGDKVERELQQLRRQISSEQESTNLATNFPDLISAVNKVFGEGKWNHTVVSQTLEFDYTEINCRAINASHVYRTGCVSFVKVQLENENFHEDVGYFNAEEAIRGLSIHRARIGSAVNGLKRVLLSFGEKIEIELQQLQRQVILKQVSDIIRDVTQWLVNTVATTEPMDLIAELPDLISVANKVFGEGNWRHTVVKQTLDFNYEVFNDEGFDIFHDEISARNKYVAGCVSYVKVQFKNENFHVDVGYCSTKEPTRGLAKLNAKIGSAINALKRVLMSFGEQFERELQHLQRQISPEQTDDVQRDVA
ncbi:uncharacterized protein LOC112468813 isoform X3 [Temnothorax curvispinosus]|uniref:Uncharacterized protein LOC112468813 isoform X3 n=1 Tax=Temnothorax curvispinosus TaxID=300111 RepID=A0A6J1RGP2_9HYME|nr:uncharacterized protein LOC112468813 isoform X3 [Temnothorax curvispinosus]